MNHSIKILSLEQFSFFSNKLKLFSKRLLTTTRSMSTTIETQINKRDEDDDNNSQDNRDVKRIKINEVEKESKVVEEDKSALDGKVESVEKQETLASKLITKWKPRKYVILLCYCGHGYYGLQRQSWDEKLKTIEGDLVSAIHSVGLTKEEHYKDLHTMHFQRAARTDKGVSAVKQIISLNLPLEWDKLIPAINQRLPKQIRIITTRRVTKYFDAKNFCDARSYSYLMPTYALCPVDQTVQETYRATSEVVQQFNDVLRLYLGTHNYHNFTSQKSSSDPSASRYIIEIECGQPFLNEQNMEFVKIRVKGQSFMLHQIRKMIGLAIAVMRGYATHETIYNAFNIIRIDIPKAPGLGLMLEEVHYDRYNTKYGGDGMHDALTWDEFNHVIDRFRQEAIYPVIYETEKNEKSMMEWLKLLPLHAYDVREPGAHRDNAGRMLEIAAKNAGLFQIKKTNDNKDNEISKVDEVNEEVDCKQEECEVKGEDEYNEIL